MSASAILRELSSISDKPGSDACITLGNLRERSVKPILPMRLPGGILME
jgi:hypothetical protein